MRHTALAWAMAAATAGSAAGETRVVVAGARYRANALHELFLGRDYRDLWTTPVEIEVLDLALVAGGLRPVRRVGGQQTRSLALAGADGKAYTFRSLDKDPTAILPPDLQDTIADRIVQDQIAAGHPAGSVVAAALLEAAGVLHATPRLVVLPDDPTLGEFREEFAGVPGTFEEFPQPGFAGAAEVISAQEAWTRFEAGPADRPDPRAFLRARLMDLLIGDWDRHRRQWRWALLPGNPLWQLIPEDRDQAFSRFEGLVLSIARNSQPRFVEFGPRYPGLEGLTFNGWEQDRAVLAALEWPSWEETATDLRRRLTDEVVDSAVARMPSAYRAQDGDRLASDLKARRDELAQAARAFYLRLAGEVDLRLTDAAEIVTAERSEDGGVELTAALPGGAPFFRRRLRPSETREVRIHLGGGDDRLVVRGPRGPILLRAVGGPGDDRADDSAGGGLRFSDDEGRVRPGSGTRYDDRPYRPPPPNPKAPWIPPRDWGRRTVPLLWLSGGPEIGVFLGGGVVTTGYGFRKDPHADRQVFRAGYATTAEAPRIEYSGDFRRENSRARFGVFARASGIEILRFYGYGNETTSDGPDETFKVEQRQLTLSPALNVGLGRRSWISVGPVLQYAHTDLQEGRLIAALRPYGVDSFGQAGARLGFTLDTRDRPSAATGGAFVFLESRLFPALWDVESAFGDVRAEASTYWTPASRWTLALRAGGRRVFGTYPFHEAAFVGGPDTVRAFRSQRFAGDGALWGNAELRVLLARFFLLLPGELGLFALGDAGRVWLEAESSDRWHGAVGGGLWLACLGRSQTVTLSVARTRERTAIYLRGGFAF